MIYLDRGDTGRSIGEDFMKIGAEIRENGNMKVFAHGSVKGATQSN
jgi:hypothetical protein